MGRVNNEYVRWVPKAPASDLFPWAYELKLIESIDQLKEILAFQTDYMSFDTETTGLNQEEIFDVGYSICMDGKTAYYVPVNHYNFGLGQEALDLVYDKMCNTKIVFMFNMRYDVRVMEYDGYVQEYNNILLSDLPEIDKEKAKVELSKRPFYKYDMSKINIIDVQAMVYLSDTNIKYPSLKDSEEWFLGWRGTSFEDTISKAENPNAVTLKIDKATGKTEIKQMNFYYLTPQEAYEYAAVDALGTYLLGFKMQPFLEEAKASGQLDINCLMPLTRFENELTLIDTDKLKGYSTILDKKIKDVQHRCWTAAGKEFNLGSSKDCNTVLKSLNIHTGVVTKRGEMSTSKESIKACLDKLDKNDPNRQFLTDLTNYGTYTKQKGSYIDNIIDMAENNEHHKNRLRFSYKTCEVPSGRLAAGGDKKNAFFANANIQNITKPHVTSHFAIREDLCKQYYPDIIEEIDKSGTREEAITKLYYRDVDKIAKLCIDNECDNYTISEDAKRLSYRIYGWVFSDKPWLIPNQEEIVVEGFIQDLNVRSVFLPDDNYYWVSLDFNAQEIRVPALWSKEPAWLNAFVEGKDVHKSTAVAIWGEENYSKDKRKLAKGANFGLLYGMTARNFKDRFNMTYEEAEDFVNQFKSGLPVLFKWIASIEHIGEKEGTVSTMLGRPRRLKSWFDTGEWSWINFAKRTAVNTVVQGTGADILKIVLIRIFNTFYNGAKPMTKLIRFKNTIHDEINYQIYKDKEHNHMIFDKTLSKVIELMRVRLPGWEFPMEVGLSIGNRWGQSVDFDFDKTTFRVTVPKGDPISDKDICKALNINIKNDEPADNLNVVEESIDMLNFELSSENMEY